jgi:hypothetical protein
MADAWLIKGCLKMGGRANQRSVLSCYRQCQLFVRYTTNSIRTVLLLGGVTTMATKAAMVTSTDYLPPLDKKWVEPHNVT